MNKIKQAVLVIHGIGEQRPMSTLREFVAAVLQHDEYSSKPDKIDTTYELRKLSDNDPNRKVGTDFYEYYWAYRFRDSKLRHIWLWLNRIWNLDNLPERIKNIQRKLVKILSVLIAASFYLVIVIFLSISDNQLDNATKFILNAIWFVAYTIGGISLTRIKTSAVDYAGDAARYLDSLPDNITERYQIKKNGIEIIHYLHRMDYERIVVVGHSLGSVIGYDIIKHAWIDYNQQIKFESGIINKVFENISNDKSFQDLQHRLWHLQDKLEINWKISDFITLGSPLTYSNFLLAESNDEFKMRTRQRELPACPPVEKEVRFKEDPRYGYIDNKDNKEVLHHAAMFALTRWTNIFFPGDLIGGKLAPLFGEGIIDKKATLISEEKALHNKITSHTKYWLTGDGIENEALVEIKNIIFEKDPGSHQTTQ